jgi:hypothetical protein
VCAEAIQARTVNTARFDARERPNLDYGWAVQHDPQHHYAAALAHAADRRQAVYYRMLLHHQRTLVEQELTENLRNLVKHRDSGDLRMIKRLKRAIHAKEADRHAIDRLIAALDQRLGTGRG